MPSKIKIADLELSHQKAMNQCASDMADIFEEWADDLDYSARQLKARSNAPSTVKAVQLKQLQSQLLQQISQLYAKQDSAIKSSVLQSAQSAVIESADWLGQLGFPTDAIVGSLGHVPISILNSLWTGSLYQQGSWTPSKAIWSDLGDTSSFLQQIVADGIAMNLPVSEIAENVASCVKPSSRKPWNYTFTAVDKTTGELKKYHVYPKKVDYSAQRLVRTLSQHAYQQTMVSIQRDNPLCQYFKWHAIGGRACPLCQARNGRLFKKDEVPLDHPNGMCILEPVYDENADDRLAAWVNGADDPELDNYAKQLGCNANSVKPKSSSGGQTKKATKVKATKPKTIKPKATKTTKPKSTVKAIDIGGQQYTKEQLYGMDFFDLMDLASGGQIGISSKYEDYINPSTGEIDMTKVQSQLDKLFSTKPHKKDTTKSQIADFEVGKPYYFGKPKSISDSNSTPPNYTQWRDIAKQQRSEVFRDQEREWESRLSKTAKSAIAKYTNEGTSNCYKQQNGFLRFGRDVSNTVKNTVNEIKKAIDKSMLPEDTILVRGTSKSLYKDIFDGVLADALKSEDWDSMAGQSFIDPGFLSTSPTGGEFGGNLRFVIRAPAGTKAAYVELNNKFHEREMIVQAGTQYYIEGVEHNSVNNNVTMYLTIIGQP